ncbi:alanine--glyoxylate aminotransferase family protein, partial [candidate division WOR-3 bacterium]|nr:alanine--glyoxylate aminotransferase family protein [candidate division WOR-3 bacterium]
MHKKLFIPGPTEVREDILDVMKTPMIGHRSKEFSELYDSVIPKVKKVFYTENKVFLSTSSATGLMEGAIRNCVKERALNLVCGAFSKRWHQITKANGKEADVVEVEWGKAILPEMVRDALKTGKYDAVTFVHNETSTGVMNPIYEIAEVMKEFPDVSFLVDAVSSMVGVKIEVDRLGIDVCLAGVQKAFALPPGLALCSVSEKALKKAESIPNRGYYFDFLTFLKYDQDKHQTPTTPIISIIFALDKQLDRFFEEGLENRFARHLEMANYVRDWTRQYFAFFPDEKYLSNTLTAIKNTRGISVADLNKELGKRGAMIS